MSKQGLKTARFSLIGPFLRDCLQKNFSHFCFKKRRVLVSSFFKFGSLFQRLYACLSAQRVANYLDPFGHPGNFYLVTHFWPRLLNVDENERQKWLIKVFRTKSHNLVVLAHLIFFLDSNLKSIEVWLKLEGFRIDLFVALDVYQARGTRGGCVNLKKKTFSLSASMLKLAQSRNSCWK